MKWSIQELRQIASQPMMIQESVDMKEQMKAVIPELIDMSPVSVDGMVEGVVEEVRSVSVVD